MSGPSKPVSWYHLARGLRDAGATLTKYGQTLAAAPRRICCFCNADLGPAPATCGGDSHGMCDPICPAAVAMGWDI